MDRAELLAVIAKAKAENAEELDLSSQGLREIPPEIVQLKKLRKLSLSRNQITHIPPEFSQLKGLRHLHLYDNQITHIPPEFSQLKGLRILHIQGNQLTHFPPEFSQLKGLRHLHLYENQIAQIPPEIAQLQSLQILYLHGNQITHIPPEIAQLQSLQELRLGGNQITQIPLEIAQLKSLQSLHLQGNQITQIPPEIAQLKSLQSLYLHGNQITQIPPEIAQLISLQSLHLQGNQITQIPPEIAQLQSLQILGLHGNQITHIPPEIAQLKNLQSLYLHRNQITEIPPKIAQLHNLQRIELDDNPLNTPLRLAYEDGLAALKSYLQSLTDEGKPHYEAKVLLVGEGNVGKTSLFEALKGGNFQKNRPTTHGINVGSLSWHCPSAKDIELKLNFWDFGGQEVYRITHQFFYSNRSLYLLVWKPREGKDENRLESWLKQINDRVSNDVRVLLVATHSQERPADLDYPSLKAKFGKILVGHFQIDSSDNTGIEELKVAIRNHALQLPQMGEPWSARWIRARDKVAALAQTKPRISRDRFDEICESEGLDSLATETLIGLLHDLGHLIHYGESESLRDFVVLNPEWLTKAIGYILSDRTTLGDRGVLDHKRLKTLWYDHDQEDLPVEERMTREKYDPKHYSLFLRLMEKFDISYRLPDQESKSLIGQLVPWERPETAPSWNKATLYKANKEIRLDFEFDDLPPGLVEWLIVRLHHFSTKNHWRKGMYLKDRDGEEALLELDTNKRRLSIIVRGFYPDYFMSRLRDGVNFLIESRWPQLISKSKKKNKYRMMIPCLTDLYSEEPCEGRFPLAFLHNMSLNQTIATCQTCYEGHPISELLKGFTPKSDADLKIINENVSQLREDIKDGTRFEAEIAKVQRDYIKLLDKESRESPRAFELHLATSEGWNPKKYWQQEYTLKLWCEAPHHAHCCKPKDSEQTGPIVGEYQFTRPREWFEKFGPYLPLVAKIVKLGAILSGAALPYFVTEEAGKSIVKATGAIKGAAGAVPDYVDKGPFKLKDHARDDNSGDKTGRTTLKEEELEGLHALRSLLRELDPDRIWGGLRLVQDTATGDYLWVCREHYKKYEPDLPKMPETYDKA